MNLYYNGNLIYFPWTTVIKITTFNPFAEYLVLSKLIKLCRLKNDKQELPADKSEYFFQSCRINQISNLFFKSPIFRPL
jgi:hypothetical protein